MHIFLNYRRADSPRQVSRVYERLAREFGSENVFLDLEALAVGVVYVEALIDALARCAVLLVLIGPKWVSLTGPDGRRRIDEPNDFVRLEIEAALEGGIRVIPVLIDGAAMPAAHELPETIAPLGRREAAEVKTTQAEFNLSMARLSDRLKTLLKSPESADGAEVKPRGVPIEPR